MTGRRRLAAFAGAALLVLVCVSDTALAASPYRATIRRTAHGIPHIVGEDFGGLGYGYGYAFAQDNICDDRRHLRDRRRRALALLRARRHATLQRGNGVDRQQPRLRLLLPADHRRRSTVEKLLRAAAAAGPLPEVKRRACAATSPATTATCADTAAPTHPRPALPRQAVGAADHRDGRLPALLPARLLASQGVAIDGIAERAAADAGGLPPPAAPTPPADSRAARRTSCRCGGIGSNAVALGTRRHARPQARHAARQPALPVARVRALLPGAAHDPRASSNVAGASPVRRAARS